MNLSDNMASTTIDYSDLSTITIDDPTTCISNPYGLYSNPYVLSTVDSVISLNDPSEPIAVFKDGDIIISKKIRLGSGDYLDDRLSRIEQALNIPTRNVEMEAEYDQLRELYKAYERKLAHLTTLTQLQDSSKI